jgi:hypothetical protein
VWGSFWRGWGSMLGRRGRRISEDERNLELGGWRGLFEVGERMAMVRW